MMQNISRAMLKEKARDRMAGNYGNAILLSICRSLITFSLTFAISMIFSMFITLRVLAGGSSQMSLAEYLIMTLFMTLCSIFAGVFQTGMTLFFLNLASGKPATVANLFYGFRYLFKKSFILSAVLILLNTACTLPYNICDFLVKNSREPVFWALLCIAFLIIGMCIYIPIALGLSQSYFLLLDFPQYNATELMKLSFRIMKGHKWELFCLRFSFLPLGLLTLLSFGIGALWLGPYMSMTNTLYFLNLMQQEHRY